MLSNISNVHILSYFRVFRFRVSSKPSQFSSRQRTKKSRCLQNNKKYTMKSPSLMYKKHRSVVANKANIRSLVLSPRKLNKSIVVENNHKMSNKNGSNKIFSLTMGIAQNVNHVSLLAHLETLKLLVFSCCISQLFVVSIVLCSTQTMSSWQFSAPLRLPMLKRKKPLSCHRWGMWSWST